MKPAVRLAAINKITLRCIVFTHDSVFLGEDGPTHQPIEQLAALRSIPNVTTIRPADSLETLAAWKSRDPAAQGTDLRSCSHARKLPFLGERRCGRSIAERIS